MAVGGSRLSAFSIADLINPAPASEIDPEDYTLIDAAKLNNVDAFDRSLQPSKRVPEKGLRLIGDIALSDGVYKGKTSSRAAIFGEGTGHVSAREEPLDDEPEEDESSEGEMPEGLPETFQSSDEASSDVGSEGEQHGSEGSHDSDSDQRDPNSEPDDEKAGTAHGNAGGGHAEDDDIEREYAELQQAQTYVLASQRNRQEGMQRRSAAVQNQQKIWDSALHVRILLQKVLAGANRLPSPDMLGKLPDISTQLAHRVSDTRRAACDTLDALLGLHNVLLDQHLSGKRAGAPQAAGAPAKRQRMEEGDARAHVTSTAAAWQQLQGAYDEFLPLCNAAVDRWHRRAVLVPSRGGVQSGLRMLNRSLSEQVSSSLKDPSQLIARTRLPKHRQPGQLLMDGASGEGERMPEVRVGVDMEQSVDFDADTYDDSDFYQLLLREFLDANSAQVQVANPAVTKMRKRVDRRASKGRKIRYDIHEKLVNFMAPREMDLPSFASQLFANLFAGDH